MGSKSCKLENKICATCGKEFKTSIDDKVCCSNRCLSLHRASNLQIMFEEGKITSSGICSEAFYEITNFMKNLLATELIKKGYFKNGVRQDNYGDEELLDCFIYVMEHVYGTHVNKNGKLTKVKYDPTRVNLATFINIWTRGFCSLVRQTDKNRHKYNKHRTLSLDEVSETYTPEELIQDEISENIDDLLQKDIFSLDIDKKVFDDLYEEISEELEDINISFD